MLNDDEKRIRQAALRVVGDGWLSFAALFERKQIFCHRFLVKDQITVFVFRVCRMFKIDFTVCNFDRIFNLYAKRFGYYNTRFNGSYSKTFLNEFVQPGDLLEPFFEHGQCIGVNLPDDAIESRINQYDSFLQKQREFEKAELIKLEQLKQEKLTGICACPSCGKKGKKSTFRCGWISKEVNGNKSSYQCMSCWNKSKPLRKIQIEIEEIKTITNKLQKNLRESNVKRIEKHNSQLTQNLS